MGSTKSTRRPTPGPGRAGSARARLAAEQAQAARRRRRLVWVVMPLAVVLVVVGGLVVAKLAGLGSPTPQPTSGAAAGPVVEKVTSVPPEVLNQVGAGTLRVGPRSINAPALTAEGKPRVVYIGAEYCPFCAGERWAMVVALSRFGSFQHLGQTSSSARPGEPYPATATLSFHASTFTSPTISFTGVETETNQWTGSGYAPLDTPSAPDQQIFSTYNFPPYVAQQDQGSIPFLDIGGKYLVTGASYDVGVLQGKTQAQIASALSDPNSDIAKAVDGTANTITAAVCATTNNQPNNICAAAGVRAAGQRLS